jgi:hypothetical protein
MKVIEQQTLLCWSQVKHQIITLLVGYQWQWLKSHDTDTPNSQHGGSRSSICNLLKI